MLHFCKVCQSVIPKRRVELGYPDTCVQHSTTQRYTGNIVAETKATTFINIIRDPEAAKHISMLGANRGK